MPVPTNPRFQTARWEGDEFVVVFDGDPIGSTLTQSEAARIAWWLNTNIGEILQKTR